MDTGKGSSCSTNSSNECPLELAGGIDSCGFALRGVEPLGKPAQFDSGKLTLRSRCQSSAALQSCWVQRLNLFTSTSDVEEELSGRKPPEKHIHVWTHFAKDFSSCRRPNAISHSRSSSWPPDGLTLNEAVLPASAAGDCESSGPRNHKSRGMSSVFSDGNVLVPNGETRTENRSDIKSGSAREALVPCLPNEGTPHRTNLMLEKVDGEHDCESQNLATTHSRRTAGDRQGSQSNTVTEAYFSRFETRKPLLSFFGSESITASPAISRSDCPCEVPSDIDAKKSFLSTFVSASKADNRGARADADRRLLVSLVDIKKDQVIGRPWRVATDVFTIVDAERPEPINSPAELGDNTVLYSDAPQTVRMKDRLSCERISNRETSRKNDIMRSDSGECMNLMENATDCDKPLEENQLLFNQPRTERVWHGLCEEVEEKRGTDSKTLAASARWHHATVRSCVPETITKEDSGPSKSAESFASTGSLQLDYFSEQYHWSCATNSLTKDPADRLNDWMSGLDRPVKAGVGIHSPLDFPQWESFSRLRNDSIPLKQGKRQIHLKETHQRGGFSASTDEDCGEKLGALTTFQGQTRRFLNEPSGRIALQVDQKYAARIKLADAPLDLDLLDSKCSPNARFSSLSESPECFTDYRNGGVPIPQQAWIQRWSSSLNSGVGSVNSLRHATEKKLKLSSDIPEKLLASSRSSAMFSLTPSHKEKSYVGCIGQSSRDRGREDNRHMDATMARVDCGFKYLLGSCLPIRNQGKFVAPKAQAMAIVGASKQMGISPVKNRVLLPTVDTTVDDLQIKRIPEDTSCSSGGNGDADMDILEFLGS